MALHLETFGIPGSLPAACSISNKPPVFLELPRGWGRESRQSPSCISGGWTTWQGNPFTIASSGIKDAVNVNVIRRRTRTFPPAIASSGSETTQEPRTMKAGSWHRWGQVWLWVSPALTNLFGTTDICTRLCVEGTEFRQSLSGI